MGLVFTGPDMELYGVVKQASGLKFSEVIQRQPLQFFTSSSVFILSGFKEGRLVQLGSASRFVPRYPKLPGCRYYEGNIKD